MLNTIIRFALQQRLLTMAIAMLLVLFGSWQIATMPVDVFPDLNRPRVVIMTEAAGLAPEEVELLVTFPLESALNGASGVEAVRSSSGVGISIIYVEFAYGTDIYTDRQIVTERMQMVQERLPAGTTPQLAPIASIMGQVLMLGMWNDNPDASPMDLRTEADWVVRQRLLTIPGVSQVFTMGGDRKQFQVRVDPDALVRYGVTFEEVERALSRSNSNATGGYLDKQGPNELLVRSLGRIHSIEELEKIPIKFRDGRPVLVSQVAEVVKGAQVKRGDSAAYVRIDQIEEGSTIAGEAAGTGNSDAATFLGGPAVVFTVSKQPGADTRRVTKDVLNAIEELRSSLPEGTQIVPVYAQMHFIDRAIANVYEALRDGSVLVVIILFLFLLNLRTTFITLTAIPLSLVMTAIVFSVCGLSINTMTLGGIAVAMGELVDDAIVDVENIFRRLKENRIAASPENPLLVVYRASLEVRRSIVFGTLIVILVFIPLFALGGMEGKLFAPLGVAYIVSILSSLIVSLTITPLLSFWLLGSQKSRAQEADGWILAFLKWIGERVIRFGLAVPSLMLFLTVLAVAFSGLLLSRVERDFLPPFNEGTIQLNVVLPPGTSLASSTAIASRVEMALQGIKDVKRFSRRTGRAELDEHAEGVNSSEFIIELDPDSPRTRTSQLNDIRSAMEQIPGIVTSVEQPLAHLISHMLSGVKAQIGIKIYGDDLDVLRKVADSINGAIKQVPGVTDAMVEPQVLIPQLRIELNRDRLQQFGLSSDSVNETIETAMNGRKVSEVLEGTRSFDLVVRANEAYREDISQLERLAIPLPGGGSTPLMSIARIYEASGPNVVNRENVRRRTVVQCNVANRGVVDVVEDVKQVVGPIVRSLPSGYFIEYSGQFESQQAASRIIALLSIASLLAVFFLLYALFRSVVLALQVMAALPMAFIGGAAALLFTGQTFTIASMVGFISLAGIASRNGILLLQHYLYLMQNENEAFSKSMIVRAGIERLAPVLMTALTSGIGLVPLVLSSGEAGKEILYPVATVILGGLFSCTLLDFFVRPALFWKFGKQAAELAVERRMETNLLETCGS